MAVPIKGQIKIGLIGAGLIGQAHSMMLRLIADRIEASVRIDSIYDVAHAAAEQLAAKWPGAKVPASLREVIDDPAIDAVFVCTPTASYREDAAFLAALRGDTKPDSPFGAGVAAERIVELAYESARLRMPIEVEPWRGGLHYGPDSS